MQISWFIYDAQGPDDLLHLYPFQVNVPFLHALQTLKNLWSHNKQNWIKMDE